MAHLIDHLSVMFSFESNFVRLSIGLWISQFDLFLCCCKCSEKAALQALKASNWHLEGAFDVFYSQTQVKPFADTRRVEELYNRYKGKRGNSIAIFCTLACSKPYMFSIYTNMTILGFKLVP